MASWEKEFTDKFLSIKFQTEAYNYFKLFLSENTSNTNEVLQSEFICLDIERKNGKFKEAKKRLDHIKKLKLKDFQSADIIIKKQTLLIDNRQTKEEFIK